MTLRPVYITAAARSPVAPRGGALAALELHELAAPVIHAAVERAGLRVDQVDEVITANAIGGGGNPARVAALAAGLPLSVAGLSIDRQCVGGLDTIALGHAMIASGQADVVIAGGVESYSRRPLRLRTFSDGRAPEAYDQPPFAPWPDRDPDMTTAAADMARDSGITRAEQDDFAIRSHARARVSKHPEIVPMAGLSRDGFTRDLTPKLAARAPVLAGDITTATTAIAADGAAFVTLSATRPDAPHLVMRGAATVGAAPETPTLSPLPAIARVMAKTGLTPDDLTHIEMMEAYAAQAIACVRGANLPMDKVNTGGGALARGHPIGASGAILATRLFSDLIHAGDGAAGLAAIAAAGGLGSAMILRAQV